MTYRLIDKLGQVWEPYPYMFETHERFYREEEDCHAPDFSERWHTTKRQEIEGARIVDFVLMSAKINAPDRSFFATVVTVKLHDGSYHTISAYHDPIESALFQDTLVTTISLYAERDFFEAVRTARKSILRDFPNA